MSLDKRRRFLSELFNDTCSMLQKFAEGVFNNGHTIGAKIVVEFREALLAAFRREHVRITGLSTIPPPELK